MGNMGMDLSENRVPPKFNGSSMSTIIFPSNRTIFGYPLPSDTHMSSYRTVYKSYNTGITMNHNTLITAIF